MNRGPGVKVISLGKVFADYYVKALSSVSGKHSEKQTWDVGSFLLELSVAMINHDVVIAVADGADDLTLLLNRIKAEVGLFCRQENADVETNWLNYKGKRCVALIMGGEKKVYVIPQNNLQTMEAFSQFVLPSLESQNSKNGLGFFKNIFGAVKNVPNTIPKKRVSQREVQPRISANQSKTQKNVRDNRPSGAERNRQARSNYVASTEMQRNLQSKPPGRQPSGAKAGKYGAPVFEKRSKAYKEPVPLAKKMFAMAASATFVFCAGYLIHFYVIEPANNMQQNEGLTKLYDKSFASAPSIPDDTGSMYSYVEPYDGQGGQGTETPQVTNDENSVINEPAENPQSTGGNTATQAQKSYPTGMQSKFKDLFDMNSDVIGWIEVPGTVIDYPVVKTKDNNYYLEHNYKKEKSRFGAVFADYQNIISQNGTSTVTHLYGHQMANGTMFAQLSRYRDLSFYRENPVFKFDTLYANAEWKVFSVFVASVDPEQDNGQMFNWRITDFGNEEKMMAYVDECKQRSLLEMPVDIEPTDKLITLTVCAKDFNDARLVVAARRVRDGESSEVDTAQASVNENPLYPQIWYDENGGDGTT